MTLNALPWGQIRPQGWIAAQMRQTWEAGLAEGSPSWVHHALLVGEGKGTLLVRAWARRSGASWVLSPPELGALADQTSWADEWEDRVKDGSLGLDEYVGRLVLADPAGLRVALYGPAVVKTEVAGVPLTLELDTAYPGESSVEVRLYPEAPVEFTLFFRIPGWAGGCLVTGDGASEGDVTDQDGWIVLRRPWNRGDSLRLSFDPGPEDASHVPEEETVEG